VDAGSLLSSLAISSVGYMAFSYGRRLRRAPQLALGLTLMVFPYFVDSMWLMLAIAGVLCLGAWFAVRLGW
jgi:hypothetical protein